MDDTLKIASLNCRGLGGFHKRRDVFSFLREKNFSIYLLQDTHFTCDIEERISREWGYDCYFSSFRSNSRGVSILINNNIEYKLINLLKDDDGNILILRITAFERDFVIVCLYGPNDDNPEFYVKLEEMIQNIGPSDNVIVGGDFNLVMNFDIDCFNYRHRNNVNASDKVLDLMHNLDLLDIWREINPDTRRYTWRRSTPCQQSRLDFFLVSDTLAPLVKDVDIKPGYKTDHSLITLSFQFSEEYKRNQFWKFNTSLLADQEYLENSNNVIKDTVADYAVFPYNRESLITIPIADISLTISDQLFLDVLLMKIRSKTISFASYKKRKFQDNEKQLLTDIENLENKDHLNEYEQDLLKSKREELENIRDFRLRGVLLRSRARWVEDGEKVSSYFCSLEKRNYINKSIGKVTLPDDSTITNKKDIVNEFNKFYKNLYSKKDVRDAAVSDLVDNLPQLTDLQANQLEGLLTLDEISDSLKNMKNGKSPGSDGFPAEFFKVFWRQLGGFVLRSLTEGFVNNEMSTTQKEGVIICIPKSDKDRDKIKNWRPISLLNTVYKIGSSSIANRLKEVLPSIIDEDQTCFIRNRYIGDNIRLIYDIISHLNNNNEPGLLLCLDFEKAFDSVDWGFLHKVLNAFGFKNDFCRWISALYNNIRSTVSINGMISDWFNVTRGCRQGDPISPYLFILCAEIMGCMIRENNNIKGIKINDTEIKLSQYADDSEIILQGDRNSFEETIQVVQLFGEVSGLVLNTKKTNSIWLGRERNSQIRFMQHLDICWNPAKFKVLGIWFSNDLAECIAMNYNDKHLEIKQMYKIWLKRQITPLGRVAILKSLILSKLIFLWILLPNPPDGLIKEIQSGIFEFVWASKYDRINRRTSTKNIKDGGIGIPDVRRYLNALKLTWIKKLINSNHKWKSLLLYNCPFVSDIDKLGPLVPTTNMNVFWKNVFTAYCELEKVIPVKTACDFLAEPIFYNCNIKINHEVLFIDNWYNSNVYKVGNFFDQNGQPLTFRAFNQKFNVNTPNFLLFHGCLEAIRAYKRRLNITIENDDVSLNSALMHKIITCPSGAKYYYDTLCDKSEPNFCNKWNEKLNENVNWKTVFYMVSKMKEIKLRWFQLRIMNRIIGTNITLKAMNIRDDDLCTFCNEETETIEHLFTECMFAIQFWNNVKALLMEHDIIQNDFLLDPKCILFGNSDNTISDALLYFIQVAKYFIYKSRCEECIPIFETFKGYFKKKFQTIKYIAMKNNALDKFEIEWELWINFTEA